MTEDRRKVEDFSSVEVHDGLHGTITSGPTSVVVKIDSNLQQYLRTVVSGRNLDVGGPDDSVGVDMHPSRGHEIRIQSPRFERIALSGGSDFVANVTPTETLTLKLSGGSHLNARSVDSKQVRVSASGGSTLNLEGRAPTLTIEGSGGSQLKSALPAESVEVHAGGATTVEVRATRSIRVHASGGSRVVVHGHPTEQNVEKSGGSTVTFVD